MQANHVYEFTIGMLKDDDTKVVYVAIPDADSGGWAKAYDEFIRIRSYAEWNVYSLRHSQNCFPCFIQQGGSPLPQMEVQPKPEW